MAAIQSIRSKSGLLIVVVGVALAAFVLTDLFKNLGKPGLDYDPSTIAYINGEKLQSNYFQKRYEESMESVKQQNEKQNLTDAERYQTMIQTWEMLKKEELIRQEAEAMGLAVENGIDPLPGISKTQYSDLIFGNNPHPYIKQNFTNPNTQQYDPNTVKNWLNNIEAAKNSANAEERQQAMESEKQWKSLERYLKTDALLKNYLGLVEGGFYMPEALAELDYKDQNDSKSLRFFGIRYNTIQDSNAVPTEEDYQTYYEEHKYEFEIDKEMRDLRFIVWNVMPTQSDINKIKKEVDKLYTEFKEIEKENVASFVSRNSTDRIDTSWKNPNEISAYIDSSALQAENGYVFPPFRENNAFNIVRLMGKDVRPDSLKAQHILIQYAGAARAADTISRTKITAQQLADSIKNVVQNDVDNFQIYAFQNSDDPTVRENMGDLGWFADGEMIPEFNQACINNDKGDVVVVETALGFHVIYIEDKLEATPKVQIAKISVPVTFSNETYDSVYSVASMFASVNRTYKSFDTAVINQGLNQRNADNLDVMSQGLPGLSNSRDIVQWAFREGTEEGNVSGVFDYNERIVVAAVNNVKEEGIQDLEDVKDGIEPMVVREVKADMIIEDYKSLGFDQAKTKANVAVDTMDFYNFKTYSLPVYGPEPKVQGLMAVTEPGSEKGPVKGSQGVFYFKVDNATPAKEAKDYSTQYQSHDRLMSQRVMGRQQQGGDVYKAIDEKADIQDFRKYFY